MADRTHLEIDDRIRIPLAEFTYQFSRSSGPGGQNVNKVSTKVDLRWRYAESSSLPDEVKARLAVQQRRRITADGELAITSQRYRSQNRNLEDCWEKLRLIVEKAAKPPKARRPTRPTTASKQRRKQTKIERARRKQLRKKPDVEE